MKNLIFFLIFLFFSGLTIQGQTVYSDPEFLTADEPVTIYFNASGTPLENYSGDIYTHTGITIGENQWQYVIGDWGVNTTQPKLTKVTSNLYKLVMDQGVRDFYGAPAAADITELCFVFRSDDSDTQTADLFLPVFNNELSIVIQSPELYDDIILLEGDSIFVSAVSPLADSMYLYLNNEKIAAVEGFSINDTIIAENVSNYGDLQWVTVKAMNETEMVADSFSFQVLPPPPVAELPAGITDGINYISETSVILCLYAPGKRFVFVIGEFNEFTYSISNYMNLTPDGNRFWIQIDGLVPGQEYAFQYTIEDEAYIGDPYCEKVLDPWNDQYINNATYPNLKPYPLSNNQGIMSVLQTNQEPYNWQNTSFTPPAKTDLVIYELLIRDFTAAHTYNSLIDTLNYLKNLGINAIELMPVNEFEGNLSWGYNPNYYFAPDKYYGPKNTLKAFIDACHNEGIAVILDVVYNHSFGTSPYVLMYWDPITNAPSADSPFYNSVPKHDFNVGFDMNHESPATKQYISRALKFWLTEYKVDGYRFDLSKGFTQKNTLGNTGAWGQYDQSRIDILNQYADTVFAYNSNAYVILEHFADNSEEKVLSSDGMMLWGNMNYAYTEASMGWNNTSDLSWGSYKQRGWSSPHLVDYMESHDEERLMAKNLHYGNTSGNYNVQDTSTALQRAALAASFFFTIPGPKMIWQFGELGYDYWINYPGVIGEGDHRTDQKPIRWDYFSNYRRKLLYNIYASLIHLKTTYPAFSTTDFNQSVGGAQKQIQLNDAAMNVTVVGNFDVTTATMTVNFQHGGIWYDYFAGDSITDATTSYSLDLGPGEFRIYTDVELAHPEIGIGIEEAADIPNGFESVYPNPSDADFNITFNLKEKAYVSLQVYDVTGSRVKTIASEKMTPGKFLYKWNGTNNTGQKVEKGIYIAELVINGERFVSKLSLY